MIKILVIPVMLICGQGVSADTTKSPSPSAPSSPPPATVLLKGVEILGNQKRAHIQWNGTPRHVREGETLDAWKVVRIAPRTIVLRTPTGEERELRLHTAVSIPTEAAEAEPVPPNPKQAEHIQKGVAAGTVVIAPPAPEKISDGVYRMTPQIIEDKDIPAGYHRKRTPFGDFLVKDGADDYDPHENAPKLFKSDK